MCLSITYKIKPYFSYNVSAQGSLNITFSLLQHYMSHIKCILKYILCKIIDILIYSDIHIYYNSG